MAVQSEVAYLVVVGSSSSFSEVAGFKQRHNFEF
jgi:hypothetical protein